MTLKRIKCLYNAQRCRTWAESSAHQPFKELVLPFQACSQERRAGKRAKLFDMVVLGVSALPCWTSAFQLFCSFSLFPPGFEVGIALEQPRESWKALLISVSDCGDSSGAASLI